jgi:hypothetical protein
VVQYHLVATVAIVEGTVTVPAVTVGMVLALVVMVVVPFLPVEETLPEVTVETAPAIALRGTNLLPVWIILAARFLAVVTAATVIRLRLTSLVSSNRFSSPSISRLLTSSLVRCVAAAVVEDCRCSLAAALVEIVASNPTQESQLESHGSV